MKSSGTFPVQADVPTLAEAWIAGRTDKSAYSVASSPSLRTGPRFFGRLGLRGESSQPLRRRLRCEHSHCTEHDSEAEHSP